MREDIIDRLQCPSCRGALKAMAIDRSVVGFIKVGVVTCLECGRWYPIEDHLLELLPDDLAYTDDRRRFWDKHRDRLKESGLEWRELRAETKAVESQLKQQSHFDWYAANSEQTYSSYEQMPFWRAVDEKIFSEWRKEVRPEGWLLDVGCAQGRSTFKFSELPLTLIGFDVSKALVREALASARAGSHSAQFIFFVGDASALPFKDETFDYVLIYGVLHHLPRPDQTCLEVARVLKRGGVYFGSENNVTVFRSLFDTFMKWVPLWHEEAGPQPLIGESTIRRWFAGSRMSLMTKTVVFVPPHFVNILGSFFGSLLLNSSNRIGGSVPYLRKNGGLIVVKAVKQ